MNFENKVKSILTTTKKYNVRLFAAINNALPEHSLLNVLITLIKEYACILPSMTYQLKFYHHVAYSNPVNLIIPLIPYAQIGLDNIKLEDGTYMHPYVLVPSVVREIPPYFDMCIFQIQIDPHDYLSPMGYVHNSNFIHFVQKKGFSSSSFIMQFITENDNKDNGCFKFIAIASKLAFIDEFCFWGSLPFNENPKFSSKAELIDSIIETKTK